MHDINCLKKAKQSLISCVAVCNLSLRMELMIELIILFRATHLEVGHRSHLRSKIPLSCSPVTQVAVERTKPNGRIVGIDIIPAQPPKGVSTIQGNFLSAGVQEEVKRFLSDPDRGRPKQQLFFAQEDTGVAETMIEDGRSYIDLERHADDPPEEDSAPQRRGKKALDGPAMMVDVILSDMSEPWEQTTGFWKRTLSNPYRMMNTSGIPFKDHAGSMVCS